MRILYTVPLLHTANEIMVEGRGDFANLPEEHKRPYLRFVNSYWDTIERRIQGYKVNRVYLDGYSGGYWDSLALSANLGSRVANTVLDLISKGATLEITDEMPLVAKTREIYAKLGSIPNPSLREFETKMLSALMSRDLFISRNVRATLGENEAGMLFHGLTHCPMNFKDVKLIGIYSRKKLREKLLRTGALGAVVVNMMDLHQQILKIAEKSGVLPQLADYVDNPKKYGYNYSV